MSDLPVPSLPAEPVLPQPTQEGQHVPISAPPSAQPTDPAVLEARAVEQIEAAILQTATDPAERAEKVQAIKAAYIKARYGVSLDGSGK